MKTLTKAQKQKADKIIKLLEQLSKEGITTVHVSSPSSQLAFIRFKGAIEFNDLKNIIEELGYSPNQNGVLYDAIAY